MEKYFYRIILISFAASAAVAMLLNNLQKRYFCNMELDCNFWGGFLWFLIFSSIFFIALGLLIRHIQIIKLKSKNGFLIIRLILVLTMLLSLVGNYKAFGTYIIAKHDSLIISNKVKLTVNKSVKLGIYVIPSGQMREVLRHWNLHVGKGSTRCQSMDDLITSDGSAFSLDDYGMFGKNNLVSVILSKYKIPLRNTTDGLTIDCKKYY